jgi:hypothetical protein
VRTVSFGNWYPTRLIVSRSKARLASFARRWVIERINMTVMELISKFGYSTT